jgi:hypothetical protein
MKTLLGVLCNKISYNSTWGIWAERIDGEFRAESNCRFGQMQFENGGLLDDMEFFGTNEDIENAINSEIEHVDSDPFPDDQGYDEWYAKERELSVFWWLNTYEVKNFGFGGERE